MARPTHKKPQPASVHPSQKALALHHAGKLAEAEQIYRQVLKAQPTHVMSLVNLAALRRRAGDLTEAEALLRRAVAASPGETKPSLLLAQLLDQRTGSKAAGDQILTAAWEHAPKGDTANELGARCFQSARTAEAESWFRKGLEVQPDHAQMLMSLGVVLKVCNRPHEARELMERSIALDPALGPRLRTAWLLPVIMESREDIAYWRARFETETRKMLTAPGRIVNPTMEVGTTNFHLSYHAEDNKHLQMLVAQTLLRLAPDLAWTAPHCRAPRPPAAALGRKLRLGVCTKYATAHTIAGLNQGLLDQLDRSRFELIVIACPGPDSPFRRRFLGAGDRHVVLTETLPDAHAAIAALELDALYYCDLGMDPFTLYLAYARLAPVQLVTWGHPETTGVPNVDVFISCAAMEPPDAADHYSERLVALPGVTVNFPKPDLPAGAKTRADFGLPEDKVLLLCPQAPFKFHPDFDPIVAQILRRVPDSLFVVLEVGEPGRIRAVVDRLLRHAPDVADQIVIHPYLSAREWLAMLALADVMLDTVHYSGGKTSLEALAFGTPIVTWPGAHMRARHTYGFYKLMGVDDFIASDHDHYVEIAVRLASDPAARAQARARILATHGALYDDVATIRHIEEAIVEAYDARVASAA